MRIPFDNIRKGTKKFELRLNSKSRHKMNIGDYICFINNSMPNIKIVKKIYRKFVFSSLDECFDRIDIGNILPTLFDKSKTNAIRHYINIYSLGRISKHGVVVFELI